MAPLANAFAPKYISPSLTNMTLGAQHRLKEAADLSRQHLREKHTDQSMLVEEFIAEFEGQGRDHTRWSKQFADQRQVPGRVDSAFAKWVNGT
jgi:hypothetical protein